MTEQSMWVRHGTEQGHQWSPVDGDKITAAGPKPNEAVMEPFGPIEYDQADVLPPAEPTRVVGLAKNRKSNEELPVVFLMTPTSVIASGKSITIPGDRGATWSEVELAFVVDKTARNVPVNDALEYIRGYTVANDVTTENIHNRDWHLARGKALDTYCPLGPYLVKGTDTSDLRMTTHVNGELTQETNTSARKFDAAQSLAHVSSYFTLEPGDIVLTGTPSRPTNSTVEPGDTTTVSIENIGELTNPISQLQNR